MKTQELLPAVAVLLLGMLLAAKVTGPALQQALQDQAALNTSIAGLRTEIATLPTEQARNATLQADYDSLKRNLPETEQLPQVLASLQETAAQLGIQVPRIARSVRPSVQPGVTAVDLSINTTGTYARTQAFVQTLAHLPRAYTSTGITLTALPDGETVSGTLKVTTYTRSGMADASSTASTSSPASSTPSSGSTASSTGSTSTTPSIQPTGGQP